MKAKYIIFLIFMLFLIFLEACKKDVPTAPTNPDQPSTQGLKVGDKATNFTAKDQDNKDVSLSSYLGKVVLFNFSADWCGPCREEATHLEDLYNEYKSRGFQIITILISGSPASWAQEYGLSFPVLDDNSEKIWDIYGEGSVPLNIIVDRDGIIRYKEAGYNESGIKSIIEKYL